MEIVPRQRADGQANDQKGSEQVTGRCRKLTRTLSAGSRPMTHRNSASVKSSAWGIEIHRVGGAAFQPPHRSCISSR
jgi:hypothetical protein